MMACLYNVHHFVQGRDAHVSPAEVVHANASGHEGLRVIAEATGWQYAPATVCMFPNFLFIHSFIHSLDLKVLGPTMTIIPLDCDKSSGQAKATCRLIGCMGSRQDATCRFRTMPMPAS